MKKWYAKKSIAGKLVTSFIAMGVMIIVLCLLTLNGAGLVFRLSGITAAVITGAVILLCLAVAYMTIRYFKNNIVGYIEGLTIGLDKLTNGELAYFDDDRFYDRNSKDETERIAAAFVQLVIATREKVADTKQIADGDLTTHIHVKCDGDVLGAALLDLVHNMHRLVSSIYSAADQVASSSSLVADSSLALSQGATEQASAIQELTASLVEIASQTNLNAKNAETANDLAQKAKSLAATGNEHMKSMLSAMDEINESSANISKIIKVIDDIAFQTNILALNAAVEAARAGQHGKGFAVVAEEVRNLAAKSANAAKETTALIEGSSKKVDAGTKIANDTAEALSLIASQVADAADLVSSIAQASNEQAGAIEQVNSVIQKVSQVVSTNAATSQESAAASEELSSQAARLKETVSLFKLKRTKKEISKGGAEKPPQLSGAADAGQKVSLGDGDFGKY
ncbi:MAG: methyl-accepting chemotaxis protein [Clostridiales bacterium]|jgi:methyl-accepting chemotaxis protein|nr:methyl-accepting chemotaxis protein [Clostridiales bacterium]